MLKPKLFYTTQEAGDMLFVSHSTIIEWIESGKLKAAKTLGGHRRIPKEELETFVRRNKMGLDGDKNSRILIADDDKAIRAGLKEILQQKGFEVDVAGDGFEAGVMAIQNEPSLIILDLKMHGLDGFSTCRLIKENPVLKNIKILVLTGYPTKSNLDRVLKAGADRCLAKPIQSDALVKEIKALLQKPEMKK